MSKKQFINDLSATYADIRRLDVKKINLKGKNILEYIKENSINLNDLRKGQVSSNDIWKNGLQVGEDETLTIYPIGYNKVNYEEFTDEQRSHYWNNITKVEDYVCYDSQNQVSCHLDTASLVLGSNVIIMFYPSTQYRVEPYFSSAGSTDGKSENGVFCANENITRFSSDLSNMENGAYFFYECSNLTSFTSDLSSLVYGYHMFDYCEKLDIFNCKSLNSLKEGVCMFYGCNKLTSFDIDLPELIDGQYMFDSCTSLTSFKSKNLSSLENGFSMFCMCPISSFDSDLRKLIDGGRYVY